MQYFVVRGNILFPSYQKKGRVQKWQVEMEWEVFNESQSIAIGTCLFGLYRFYLLKFPALPRVALLVLFFF